MNKKYFIKTMGCQMNVHDSEKIAGIFSEKGYQGTDDSNSADIIVLNTCSIREKAEQKFYSELGRLKKIKKHHPDLKIAVAGCIAQQKGRSLFKRFPYVDFVFGPNNLDSVDSWVVNQFTDFDGRHGNVAIEENPEYHTKLLPVKRVGQVRAWVSIMYGCDNFCAYCVVPYTRGRERSRSGADIFSEVQSLAKQGLKEVTLLGQNVNSYGNKSTEKIDFPGLLNKLHGVDGISRMRFVTSHPRDLSDKLIGAMKELPKVCNHIHLPVQSGSDDILKFMNRGYTSLDYKEKVVKLREAIPGISITTDIIVGFPGETEEDYQRTLSLLTEIEYDGIFAFKYSRRPDTKALELPGHVEEKLKSERLRNVLELQEGITYRKNKRMEGEFLEVLVEGASETDPEKLSGRTGTNKIVNFYGDASDIGNLVTIKITAARQHSLYGEKT